MDCWIDEINAKKKYNNITDTYKYITFIENKDNNKPNMIPRENNNGMVCLILKV